MNADTKAAILECLGIAEGVAMRFRALLDGAATERRSADEYRDIARTLAEVEDRVYGTGEYAETASPERGNRVSEEGQLLRAGRRSPAGRCCMTYADHIDRLLALHGIGCDWREKTAPRSWRRTRRVRLQPVRSAVTYAVALHEIGHVVGRQTGRRLDREAQAWRWAEENAIEWTEPMIRAAARYIGTYLRWCERRRGAWVPPADHDSRRIAEWGAA